ncbi:MAG TPA: MBL fold metallo-hydrolase [Woeseiaceae bacterium]|nr:MBL fold metallo-hydrolase [Woeseiaceae bacterium]
MTTGCVRAWALEERGVADGALRTRHDAAVFRRDFRTAFRRTASDAGDSIGDLRWGSGVELLDWPSGSEWTKVRIGIEEGFVRTEHLVEVAYVARTSSGDNQFVATLTADDGHSSKVLWGDYVNVIERGAIDSRVRARGITGTISTNRLTSDPLLEVYIIDVGQGDGVLVCTPDGRHMVIDGGLPRSNQLTGKNAADFIDWKFFFDYGNYGIDIDALVASHSDFDHYGGLWDLVRQDEPEKDRELDCLEVDIRAFYHPGLSRWEDRPGATPEHKDGLGPNDAGWFVRLLADRADANAAIIANAAEELGGDWGNFIANLIARNAAVTVNRLGVEQELLAGGGPLPVMWPAAHGLQVNVLAPVTAERNGAPALKDLGDTGKNTNGHSICLRLDYGHARILLTGDLNKKSMDWLVESYGDRIAAFNCDVAKACHHGSHDISYRFLEHLAAGATVVSSGDSEGFAHPRPEIVAASAVTGHREVDRQKDRLVTPLIYMTEIERSTSVGEITHIAFNQYPVADDLLHEGALFAQAFDDISDVAFPTAADRRDEANAPTKAEGKKIRELAAKREKERLKPIAENSARKRTSASYHYREVRGPFSVRYGNRSVWRSRMMTRVHYGLVNVRTDGDTIVCATIRETGEGWTVHEFKARF